MKNHWILTLAAVLIATPFAAAAKLPSSQDAGKAPTAPILAGVHDSDASELTDVLATQPPAPLGPPDLLKEYEQAMAATAQGFNAAVSQITAAVQQKKITEDQGEYLCKEAYQLAMMQFQIFSGLHDMLEVQLSQAAAASQPANPAPAKEPSGSSGNQAVLTVGAGSKAI